MASRTMEMVIRRCSMDFRLGIGGSGAASWV